MRLITATIPASMNVAGDSIAEAGVALSVVESVLPVAAVSSPLVVSLGWCFHAYQECSESAFATIALLLVCAI